MAADKPTPVGEAEAGELFCGLVSEMAIAVAVSGGPDSLALAALMARWRDQLNDPPRLHALVVDHGLRPESAVEAQRTGRTLKALGLDATIVTLSGLPASNVHAAARVARYDAMTDWMALNGFDVLATAHHRDDQLETVIMRMARDTDAGIAGIPASGWWADRRLVRPLLSLPKSRLVATVRSFGLDPVLDPSNDDPRFERARVRHAIMQGQLPMPGPELLTRAQAAAETQDELDTAAWKLAGGTLQLYPHGIACLDVAAFMDADRRVRSWLLRSVARDMGGNTVPPAGEKLDRLEQRLSDFATGDRSAGFAGATLAGVRFQRALGPSRRGMIVISREWGRNAASPAALRKGQSCLFERCFRVITSYEHTYEGLHIATRQGLARSKMEDLPDTIPASVMAGIPFVLSGETPLFPLISDEARAKMIRARWCGLRFGKLRVEARC